MKTINYIFSILLIPMLCVILLNKDISAQESNFQIAPSPIAYPYFEDGRYDGTLGISFVKITTEDMDLAGGMGDFKGRMAFSEFLAGDCDLGITGMGGSMPGLPPIMPIYPSSGFIPYFIETTGDATLTLLSFRMAIDIEIQPIQTDFGSLIIFGGPNITFSRFDASTPFNLIVPPPFSNAGEVFTGYTSTITVNSTLAGWQLGIQLDINLGSEVRLSPFFMYSSFSGTQDLTNTTDVSGSGSATLSSDIPSSTSTSMGMDIIIGDISIGTVLQQIQSTEESTQDKGVFMISVGYHFDDGTDNTLNKKEDDIISYNEQK